MTRVVTVFGGSGFLGRHLVQRLAEADAIVRVAVRDPEGAHYLQPLGASGHIVPWPADVARADTVEAAVAGADDVVNLVGILNERGRSTFQRVHVEGADNVARAAQAAGVGRLVHVSALGADAASPSAYARTKAAGEDAVRAAYPGATIMRPSVVFGPEDDFFNRFAALARFSPALPVFGCPPLPKVSWREGDRPLAVDLYGEGGTRFQPVYVGDVAEAIMKALDGGPARGRTFELGGPVVYSFKELMELVLAETGRRRLLVPVPFSLASLMAFLLETLPNPLLTRDQVKLLRRDNVVSAGAAGFPDLGIAPEPVEAILPTYLFTYRRGASRARPA